MKDSVEAFSFDKDLQKKCIDNVLIVPSLIRYIEGEYQKFSQPFTESERRDLDELE